MHKSLFCYWQAVSGAAKTYLASSALLSSYRTGLLVRESPNTPRSHSVRLRGFRHLEDFPCEKISALSCEDSHVDELKNALRSSKKPEHYCTGLASLSLLCISAAAAISALILFRFSSSSFLSISRIFSRSPGITGAATCFLF